MSDVSLCSSPELGARPQTPLAAPGMDAAARSSLPSLPPECGLRASLRDALEKTVSPGPSLSLSRQLGQRYKPGFAPCASCMVCLRVLCVKAKPHSGWGVRKPRPQPTWARCCKPVPGAPARSPFPPRPPERGGGSSISNALCARRAGAAGTVG